jgi:chemotaxis protein MotB
MSGTGSQPIIKKIKKTGHSGAHGGSWKVAYADFVTAMMAFFLLLWLISMVSEDKRARVSQYFKNFNLFDKSGQSFIMDNQVIKSKIEIVDSQDTGSETSDQNNADTSDISPVGNEAGIGTGMDNTADGIKERLKKEIELKLANMKDQVLVDIYDGAVRIEVVDKNGGSAMFNSGSREMTVEGQNALSVIAGSIRDVRGKIAIEGHTDASTYAGSQYSNWELSTERASAARRELENSGMSPDKLIRVAGYAATEPLIKDDAFDPRNRRISIRVFPEDGQTLPDNGSGAHEEVMLESDDNIKTENEKDADPIDKYLLSK